MQIYVPIMSPPMAGGATLANSGYFSKRSFTRMKNCFDKPIKKINTKFNPPAIAPMINPEKQFLS